MRRHGWLVGAMLAASMLGGAASNLLLTARLGAQGPEVVTTPQVNIVDSAGQLRAILAGEDERGLTSLSFFGPDGALRGVVGSEPDGTPVLQFNDGEGRVHLAAAVRGTETVLTIGDETSSNILVGSFGGAPVIGLAQAGQTRVQLALDTEGRPSLDLQGEPTLNLLGRPGQRAIGLSVDPSGSPFLSLYDSEGAPRVAIGAVQGTTVINLGDGTRPRLVLGVTNDGQGTVGFYDANGTLVRLEEADASR